MRRDKTAVDLLVGIITRAVTAFALPALAAPNATPGAPVTRKKIESFLSGRRVILLTSSRKTRHPYKYYRVRSCTYNKYLGGEKEEKNDQ